MGLPRGQVARRVEPAGQGGCAAPARVPVGLRSKGPLLQQISEARREAQPDDQHGDGDPHGESD